MEQTNKQAGVDTIRDNQGSSSSGPVRPRLGGAARPQIHIYPIKQLLAGPHSTTGWAPSSATGTFTFKSFLKEEVADWLAANKVEHIIDIRPSHCGEPSSITIFEDAKAMLFKLRWL